MKKKLPTFIAVTETVTMPNDVKLPAPIHPITQEFGNGDLNILRDKINEVISRI